MTLAPQLAQRFKEIYDGTWVAGTNLKAQLSDLNWEQATTAIDSLNTIAILAFHINYYVAGVTNVLEGGSLDIRDKYSFDSPPITNQTEWEQLLDQLWTTAERFAQLVEQMSDEQLHAPFVEEKYGNYLRNIEVIIEHSYYHFGQIVLIRKMLLARSIG